MATRALTAAECDEIFAPVLRSLIAISMTDIMMRTRAIDLPAENQRHDHPDRVGTASVVNFLEDFRKQYIGSTYTTDHFFTYQGAAQEDTGEAAAVTVNHTEQFEKLQDSLVLTMVANLGTTCFGYVFERWKRLGPQKSDI